ncbi:MAG: DegT/DnrJ/EryC1/StrS family aminotransferase [Candidatus Binatia bacterium]
MSNSIPFQIPIVDLRAQYRKIREQVRRAIDEVNDSQQFILGPAVSKFEALMAAYLGCQHTIGVASGSDALLLALMALDIGPGDAVITTPFTFFSTVSSITRLGAKPMFVDIDPDTYLISARGIEKLLQQRGQIDGSGRTRDNKTGLNVKALLPVHLFGQCCAMNELTDLAKTYHLRIVEDVAQACGARMAVGGTTKFAGTLGDLGCFSFFPSKNLGGFGDGGMVCANDHELAENVNMLRRHGERAKYFHEVTGLNSRLDSLQAAVLTIKQQYLETWCGERILRAENYRELFGEGRLLGNGLTSIPRSVTDKSHVFNNYVIGAERRDELKQFLAERGIQTEIYYPRPLHLQNCFVELRYKKGDFPQSELASSLVLALPLYPELTGVQQETVAGAIRDFYRA